jgi:hypothetical protein
MGCRGWIDVFRLGAFDVGVGEIILKWGPRACVTPFASKVTPPYLDKMRSRSTIPSTTIWQYPSTWRMRTCCLLGRRILYIPVSSLSVCHSCRDPVATGRQLRNNAASRDGSREHPRKEGYSVLIKATANTVSLRAWDVISRASRRRLHAKWIRVEDHHHTRKMMSRAPPMIGTVLTSPLTSHLAPHRTPLPSSVPYTPSPRLPNGAYGKLASQ